MALRAARDLDRGNVVVLLADGGWKYLSTGLWTRPLEEVAEEISGRVMW